LVGSKERDSEPLNCDYHDLRIHKHTDWQNVLQGVEVIIHSAAKVHAMLDLKWKKVPEDSYESVNVAGVKRLALMAAKTGVKKFIFLSTVKVHGESTRENEDYNEDSCYSPKDEYSASKVRAELVLKEIASHYEMSVIVIRLPLVYGPGAKGNIKLLIWLLKWRLPLPLPAGALSNRRSMVSLGNLVDFVELCVKNQNLLSDTFLISDGHDLSTLQFYQGLASAGGYTPWVIKLPFFLEKLLKRIQ
jgi:nucleoside-diphosphate-sugar epimerase